jgi:hypothetical protein
VAERAIRLRAVTIILVPHHPVKVGDANYRPVPSNNCLHTNRMVLCPCEHARKHKQKGKAKKIEADRRIDDKTFFLDGVKKTCNTSITEYLQVDASTAHVCLACLRKWEMMLKSTSEEDFATYKKLQDSPTPTPAPKKQKSNVGAAIQADHAESSKEGQCQQPKKSAFDMMMTRGGGCVCVTACGRRSHDGSSGGGADGAGSSKAPVYVDGAEAEGA